MDSPDCWVRWHGARLRALGLLRAGHLHGHGTEGSNRLTDALHVMWRHQKARDFDSARQLMRDVLAVEVVPYYRDLAQEQFDDMADDP
ncbi:DUF2379 family protein [Myxococcus xanthus]|uniref:DUF2379 family protein n=1 Tax=Myxococcus xanthus TaxID=34 RepID=UPI0019174466|nr:DUF2379 family protein [Myxococcus xanthus]QQR47728.1 DUF2379 family protein [Myxococcus xanthus]